MAADVKDHENMDSTTRPTIEVLFKHVVPLVSTRWNDIGLELGLDGETIRSIIEMNLQQDVTCCSTLQFQREGMERNTVRKTQSSPRKVLVQDVMKCKAMFHKWLETSESASWDQLIKAVKSIKLDKVAEEMEALLKMKKAGYRTTSGTGKSPSLMKFNIHIKPSKESIQLLLWDTDTVITVKEKIQEKLEILAQMQKLLYAGQELNDECILNEYNILSGSTMQLTGYDLTTIMKIRSFRSYKRMQQLSFHSKLCETLALIKSEDTTTCITLHGDMAEDGDYDPPMSPNIEEIFYHPYDNNPKNLILIEGPPGIGKTTLCNEIAFRWAKGELLTSCKLLLLLPLRDPNVRKISTIHELAKYFTQSINKTSLLCGYLENKGDVTIILDGFDEMENELQNSSFFTELIQGKLLPTARIVVTSRPSASTCLRNVVDQIVEIIGFHQTSRNLYASKVLKDSPSSIVKLQKHLQQHPNIDALCYIPSIMSIVTFLCLHQPNDLPSTASKMCRSFIILTISKYLKSKKIIPKDEVIIDREQFPMIVNEVLQQLAKFAFKTLVANKIVFIAEEISDICKDDPTCYGLLQPVEYQNSVNSYDFFHLTIQEYLAAYHITTLQSDVVDQLLKESFFNSSRKSYSDISIRLFNMWIMYVGITGGKNSSLRQHLGLITHSRSTQSHCDPVLYLNAGLSSSVLSRSTHTTYNSVTRAIPPSFTGLQLNGLHDSAPQPLSAEVHCLMLDNKNFFTANVMQWKSTCMALTELSSDGNAFSQDTDDPLRIIFLYQCFREAKDDMHCEILSESFDDYIIDLKDHNLLIPHQIDSLGLFLINRTWEALILSNCRIGDDGIILLHRYLCRDIKKEISTIDLMENNLTEVSLPFISDIITYCHPHTLLLGCNDFACVETITKAVITSSTLKVLNLWGCGITAQGAAAISDMMTALEELIVSNNNLSDDGIKTLSNGLSKSSTLQELYINDNNVGPQGILTITHALSLNTSLKILNMTNNFIGQEGAVATAEAITKNQTLTELLLYGDYTLSEQSAKLLLEKLCHGNNSITKLGLPKHLSSDNCIMSCIENLYIARRGNDKQELKVKFH